MKEPVDHGIQQNVVVDQKAASVRRENHEGKLTRNLLDDKIESPVLHGEQNRDVKMTAGTDQKAIKEDKVIHWFASSF